MPKRKIGLDIDGVYANFNNAFTTLGTYMGVFARSYEPYEQTTWNWDDGQVVAGRSTSEVWEDVKGSVNWWMGLRQLVGANEIALTNRLIRLAEVTFITTRVETLGFTARKQSELWLECLGINVKQTQVIATQGGKGKLVAAFGLDTFYDDHVENLKDIEAAGCTAICRPWPYNKAWTGIRVDPREFLETEAKSALAAV